MEIQRLRNLTTGRLHTEMTHIYEDIGYFTGEEGVMTHQLPNAMRALMPFLQDKVKDEKFFEDIHDPLHVGDIDVPAMNAEERSAFWERYRALPSPFEKLGIKRSN